MINVDDLDARANQLASERIPVEQTWRDIIRFVMPMAPSIDITSGLNAKGMDLWANASKSAKRGQDIFDSTAVVALDRLTNFMDSQVSPQSERWQELELFSRFGSKTDHESEEYLEMLIDYHFGVRYDPSSGFTRAHPKALKSTVGLGTGVYYIDEAFGRPGQNTSSQPYRYMSIPLSQCFMATDEFGLTDTMFRRYMETARNIAKFAKKRGGQASADVLKAANDPKKQDNRFEIVHATLPREDYGRRTGLGQDAKFASVYYEKQTKHVLSESGTPGFRYVVYHWSQSDRGPYGESPFHLALAEIKSLNLISKHSDIAGVTWVRPPMGIARDKSMGRPNLNPGAIIVGAIDGNGRQRIQPIRTVDNPSFGQAIITAKRENLRELLMLNVFQTLLDRPVETATAVLLREKEKAQIVGPVGARIQEGMAHGFDAEFSILEGKGAFEPSSPLAMPESLADQDFKVKSTGPLDRAQRAGQVMAMNEIAVESREFALAGDPKPLERINTDKYFDIVRDVKGAPVSMFYSPAELEEIRTQRQQAEAGAQAAAAIEQGAGAAQAAAGALQASDESGLTDIAAGMVEQ